ncbi:MAG: hypothetical protein U1E83_02330 [Methylotetracoccus sp.]
MSKTTILYLLAPLLIALGGVAWVHLRNSRNEERLLKTWFRTLSEPRVESPEQPTTRAPQKPPDGGARND